MMIMIMIMIMMVMVMVMVMMMMMMIRIIIIKIITCQKPGRIIVKPYFEQNMLFVVKLNPENP